MERVLGVGVERGTLHGVPEVVGPIGHPPLQLAHNLIAAHLHPVRRADHRGEGGLVGVVVLVEPARLEEQVPLLAPEQDRTTAVGREQVQHLRLLRGGEIAR